MPKTIPVEIITPDTATVSEPFVLNAGEQAHLFAEGLQNDDRVLIEIVGTTRSGPLPNDCAPGEVALPEVFVSNVLRCRNGARAILTRNYPSLTLDRPLLVQLRARLEADDDAIVRVSMLRTDAVMLAAPCDCVEPYCASYPLAPRGYAFADGDATDPDATVSYPVPGGTVRLYPTLRPEATVPVRRGAQVVGYALNTSACAAARAAPTYCPSLQLDTGGCDSAGGEIGYAYRDNTERDPAATVQLPHCTGEISYAYPAPGVYGSIRAEVPYYGGTSEIMAYLANRSDCAPALDPQC